MEPAPERRRSPVDLPGPDGDNSIAREPLWHAFGAGSDRPEPPSWTWDETPPPDAHVAPPPPAAARGGARTTLPYGTVDLLERAPYPHGRPDGEGDALERALVTAFGPQRREPENPYNEHRCYASPRCLFPVQAFVRRGGTGRRQLLDPERHALVDLAGGETSADARSGDGDTIVLTGRYTRIPAAYKWFRGSLVTIELGIVLRALCLGLELFGVPGSLRLPDGRSHALLAGLGLTPEWEWSLPLTIELGRGTGRPPAAAAPAPEPGAGSGTHAGADIAPEPAMADLVRVNRTQEFGGPPAPLASAVPDHAAPSARTRSWAELLWQRNSGRMPRGMHGMSGRRSRVPAEALRDAHRWLDVPPPGETLRAVHEAMKVTTVVQGVEGHADGVYRARAGEAVLHREDPTAAARLEERYGYPLAPENGCDIRHASMICFLSVRPRELAARFGPSGWSAAQYVSGWATHGLCLSAAASGLFARPVRAFKEIPTQAVLGLEPEEMIMLTVVVGTPRSAGGVLLDLRL